MRGDEKKRKEMNKIDKKIRRTRGTLAELLLNSWGSRRMYRIEIFDKRLNLHDFETFFFLQFRTFVFPFFQQNGPATAAPFLEGRFRKRSETSKRIFRSTKFTQRGLRCKNYRRACLPQCYDFAGLPRIAKDHCSQMKPIKRVSVAHKRT